VWIVATPAFLSMRRGLPRDEKERERRTWTPRREVYSGGVSNLAREPQKRKCTDFLIDPFRVGSHQF